MPDQVALARLNAVLVSRAGGYLRNPVRQANVTCSVCTTPVAGYERCFQCQQHRCYDGLADASAFLTYAVAGRQSGYVMWGYKARWPLEEHRTIVRLLLLLGLSGHARCPGALSATPVTHWATVPSLPAKPGEHPLHTLVGGFAPAREVRLAPNPNARYTRDVHPDHYTAAHALPPGSHALVIEDTWASGGHAQSAVLALRKAGATRVSLLTVARWINRDFRANADFLRGLEDRDYEPLICPWTGGDCP
jgi:predicted amidophosphoribosyltransferase